MKFLILTALEGPERQEVKKLMGETTVDFHPVTKTDYYIGQLTKHGVHQVYLGRTDQTNVNAGIETERAIQHFKPDYVFFLGVAGGLKDVKIGDIVIGKDVYGYEKGKATDKGFLPRPNFGFSSYEMERIANLYAHADEWKTIVAENKNENFDGSLVEVFAGTIAAGEKVDSSELSDLHKFLKINCSHALAIEMEGLGFLEVCRQHPQVKALLIRGISDLVENKSTADSSGSQNFASLNAAKFLFGLIDFVLTNNATSKNDSLDKDEKALILKAARELYPSGLKENSIWERAGGDLSKIALFGINGKTQWFEAFQLIEKGGAGRLTFKTLSQAMLDDYGDSPELLMILKKLAN